jgi:hypothetical protein
MVRALQATGDTANPEPDRWAGVSLGAAVFRSWTPRWSMGLQVRGAALFPAFSFQLDLVLGALVGF